MSHSESPTPQHSLEALIEAYGNAQFDCGEWNEHGEDRVPYDDYCKKADAAEAALVEAIALECPWRMAGLHECEAAFKHRMSLLSQNTPDGGRSSLAGALAEGTPDNVQGAAPRLPAHRIPSETKERTFSLRHLQENLPWTLPYSEHFEATAYPLDRVKHDVLHVMKSLGRIAAECENHDHGRDRRLIGDAFAKEVADLVICALHIAKLQGFDLHDAVVTNSEARNAATIPAEVA